MAFYRFFSVLLVCSLVGCFCNQRPMERYRESMEVMGTVVQVDVCIESYQAATVEEAMKKVRKRLREVDFNMSSYNELSSVSSVNRAQGKLVTVSQDTYHVIRESIRFHGLTQGAFDITVEPFMRLWKESSKINVLPSQEKIQEIQQTTGSRYIKLLSGHRVQLTHPGARLDLGGIAAGYGVDEAVQILRKNGFKNFMIDLGGDMYASGQNCYWKPWRIGIKNPVHQERLLDVVALKNSAVTTSGDYEKFVVIDGKRFSHIIDPETGFPERDVTSATVIAPTAIEADALATAFCVLKPEVAIKLVDSMGNGYAATIIARKSEKRVVQYKSARYSKYQFKF